MIGLHLASLFKGLIRTVYKNQPEQVMN